MDRHRILVGDCTDMMRTLSDKPVSRSVHATIYGVLPNLNLPLVFSSEQLTQC